MILTVHRIIESKCQPMHKYLTEADRWQLYLAIESGHMLYDWKIDNIVEQIFAWCRDERFMNPYMFIKKFVARIFEANADRYTELSALNTVLHRQALGTFQCNCTNVKCVLY